MPAVAGPVPTTAGFPKYTKKNLLEIRRVIAHLYMSLDALKFYQYRAAKNTLPW